MDLDYTLTRLCEILAHHGSSQTDWLRARLIELENPTALYKALNSQSMWGGAGSIANEALADNPGLDPTLWDMEIREFRSLMIDLAEHLKARGTHYPDIDFWLSAFTSWQQSGV